MRNLHKEFIEESNLLPDYYAWLEAKVVNQVEQKEELEDVDDTGFMYDGCVINYDNPNLNYQTQVCFPRLLSRDEQEQVENIINYWSAIRYVSVEGNYGIQWGLTRKGHKVVVDIDFTKSASDDIGGREVLEKLGEWIWQGTPVRKKNGRKWEGVIKPDSVKAGSM